MKQLIEALESATNVQTLFYDKDSSLWEITFYDGEPNKIDSENLLHFLHNV